MSKIFIVEESLQNYPVSGTQRRLSASVNGIDFFIILFFVKKLKFAKYNKTQNCCKSFPVLCDWLQQLWEWLDSHLK